ncbi:MAG: hypothetical protein WEA58_04180 [Balneolaceae bacterium]
MMNELENRIEIQERIDQYIQGNLSENEIDQLWVTFLDSPEWFDYFTTLVNLYSIGKPGIRN